MHVFLGLGSNDGDRRVHLAGALERLARHGLRIGAVSPVVESPALLPEGAPAEWNRPFLNLALAGELPASAAPEPWRDIIRGIEDERGRVRTSRWGPRPLDIDLLLWGRERIRSETLTIPHPDLLTRSFVLTPLVHLDPRLRIPGHEERTVLEWSLDVRPIPLWMGIVNVTPDSFSGDGRGGGGDGTVAAVLGAAERMLEAGVHVIDVGAESTRPGASALDAGTEWRRLAEPLAALRARLAACPLAPRLSVDTRHPETAARALEAGADMINDVGGLADPAMRAVAAQADCDWVVVHQLGVPASLHTRLPPDRAPEELVEAWLRRQLPEWERAGIDPRRLFLDPGIGFGKDSLQSLRLLRASRRLRTHGLRLAIGHSRKSFMRYETRVPYAERDLETIGASLQLCEQGVDMLRVHDVQGHVRAYRAWAHVRGFPAAPAAAPEGAREDR